MVFVTAVGLELDLLLLYCREGLRCDLWCLVLRWDWISAYCCCVWGGSEISLMVFGTTVGLELGLLLLCMWSV